MSIFRSASKVLLWTVIAVMALIAMLIAQYALFGSDWDLHVGHGYYLDRTYANRVSMVGPHHVNIWPNIDGYKVYERIIVGHVSKNNGLTELDAGESIPGYFVVEVSTGKVHQGLSDEAWLRLLRDYGIKERPRLYTPSRYDHYLGRNVPER